MTTTNQASENEGTKKVAMKRNMSHRGINANTKTPQRIVNEQKGCNDDPACLIVEDAYDLMEKLWNNYSYQFYEKHKAFLPIAEKKMTEYSSYSTENSTADLIIQMSKPASQLIKAMEENQKPILCVDEATANLACMLIYARTQSVLLSKHYMEIPNGEELLILSNEHFEELCSSLKLGRRTKSIMNRKKANSIG